MPTWALVTVIVGWITVWSVIGAWKMTTRDAWPAPAHPTEERKPPAMTIAMSIGAHNLSAVPIIILALIIVGAAIYFIRQRRKNPSNGHDV